MLDEDVEEEEEDDDEAAAAGLASDVEPDVEVEEVEVFDEDDDGELLDDEPRLSFR